MTNANASNNMGATGAPNNIIPFPGVTEEALNGIKDKLPINYRTTFDTICALLFTKDQELSAQAELINALLNLLFPDAKEDTLVLIKHKQILQSIQALIEDQKKLKEIEPKWDRYQRAVDRIERR